MTKTWKEITSRRPDTAERRAAYEESRKEALAEIVAHSLAELRRARHITQMELAHQLNITQPSLSGLERRGDFQLSTLRDYIEGLGGRLEISAVFDDVTIPVDVVLSRTT
jgi:DNA-binding XRE family transcriptional regulator